MRTGHGSNFADLQESSARSHRGGNKTRCFPEVKQTAESHQALDQPAVSGRCCLEVLSELV